MRVKLNKKYTHNITIWKLKVTVDIRKNTTAGINVQQKSRIWKQELRTMPDSPVSYTENVTTDTFVQWVYTMYTYRATTVYEESTAVTGTCASSGGKSSINSAYPRVTSSWFSSTTPASSTPCNHTSLSSLTRLS